MPHSSFKWRPTEFNTGVGKCSCDQTFECTSEREIAMKLRMHCRFCSKPPVAFDKIRVSKKACMMREQQFKEYKMDKESSQLISIHLDKYYHS